MLLAWWCVALTATGVAQMRVLVDHVGYETAAPKRALVMQEDAGPDSPQTFTLVDTVTRKIVSSGPLTLPRGLQWGERRFWLADFSAWQTPGHYQLTVQTKSGSVSSCEFLIDDDLLERATLSNVLFYFKSQRSSGDIDRADQRLTLPDGSGVVDLRGGWYDATGDYGIHLSHQNPTSYFNRSRFRWLLGRCLRPIAPCKGAAMITSPNTNACLLDEGLFGADLPRPPERPGGSFFESITAPGKAKLAKDREIGNPNWRTQIKKSASDSTERIGVAAGPHAYEASFRAGGGMSIAALALASTMPIGGDMPSSAYLKAAEEAFAFLEAHNTELLNDGKENILDDYCALMAATELYRATNNASYKAAADRRADHLMGRLMSSGKYRDYWRADDGTRPFFHPSDAGLPVISLLEYSSIAAREQQKQVRDAVARSLRFEMSVTSAVNNPFGYARQLVRTGNGSIRTAFFFPHDTEAAPWWQGENARLASLAAAARLAAPFFKDDPAFQSQLENYAWDQLHWILGRNPYDASMLIGSGHGNAPYMFFRSYKYTSAPGGIINGITAASQDEDGIAFNQGYAVTGADEDWRWTEEWLPHAAWYLFAVAQNHN